MNERGPCQFEKCDRPSRKSVSVAGHERQLCHVHATMTEGVARHWLSVLRRLGIETKK